ncbi:MAG TPA: arylamine N-acetyltransferase, partial [Ktedonobacteraceae bacterium]
MSDGRVDLYYTFVTANKSIDCLGNQDRLHPWLLRPFMKRGEPMDIRDYLTRINYYGSRQPTLQTLQALHHAHLLAVPFENLSIHYRQPIILQEDLLFNKIVRQHRGGFCYELNGLFAWLLRQLGFQMSLLSASVSNGTDQFSPEFDHLTVLIHQLSGANWLADVGFG